MTLGSLSWVSRTFQGNFAPFLSGFNSNLLLLVLARSGEKKNFYREYPPPTSSTHFPGKTPPRSVGRLDDAYHSRPLLLKRSSDHFQSSCCHEWTVCLPIDRSLSLFFWIRVGLATCCYRCIQSAAPGTSTGNIIATCGGELENCEQNEIWTGKVRRHEHPPVERIGFILPQSVSSSLEKSACHPKTFFFHCAWMRTWPKRLR